MSHVGVMLSMLINQPKPSFILSACISFEDDFLHTPWAGQRASTVA